MAYDELKGQRTKQELPFLATLYATYKIIVYRRRKAVIYYQEGNDTGIPSKSSSLMFRHSLKDALFNLFDRIGGGYDGYDAEIKNYYYKYREDTRNYSGERTKRNKAYHEAELTIVTPSNEYDSPKTKIVKQNTQKKTVSKMKQDKKQNKSVSGKSETKQQKHIYRKATKQELRESKKNYKGQKHKNLNKRTVKK